MGEEEKKKIIGFLLSKGIIVNEDMLRLFENPAVVQAFHNYFFEGDMQVEAKLKAISNQMIGYDMLETIAEEQKSAGKARESSGSIPANDAAAKEPPEATSRHSPTPGNVNVLFSYEDRIKKREVQDFVAYFNTRYSALRKILMNRKELEGAISISRVKQKSEKEKSAIIGMVSDKRETKKGNIIISLEDQTDTMNVLVTKNNPDLYSLAKDIVLDEVIGVEGMVGEGIIFSSNIFFPDVPLTKEVKRAGDESYAIFISDTHFGSKCFLTPEFEKFMQWINGNSGSEEQRRIASLTKYLFIVGDLVEGVGIYPSQEQDLDIPDIYEQYNAFSEQLKKIPSHIKIIICPGNHDAMRIAEPQPPIYQDFAQSLWETPNIVLVTSPSMVNIHSSEGFPGFEVLIYHGFSFPFYTENVESIRAGGGNERADLIMKFLLQRRHLAPTHTSTQYIPDFDKDSLMIEKVPDFFVTGHVHRVSVSNYRNVTLLNCSSWLSMSEYQEKVGLIPQPARAIAVNLQTRKTKILNFLREEIEQQLQKVSEQI